MYSLLHIVTWAYGKEKIRGAERNLPDFFGLCPSCQKHFPEKLSKIVVDGGGGGRSDIEKFLLDSTFPTKLTEFPTKLTEFVPFIFIISQYCPTVKRILPDWLCLPSKLGGLPPPHPVRPCILSLDYDPFHNNSGITFLNSIYILAHPVNFPCGRKLEHKKSYDCRKSACSSLLRRHLTREIGWKIFFKTHSQARMLEPIERPAEEAMHVD